MSEERSAKRAKLEADSVDANEAINFELKSGGKSFRFKPEMSHQLFGDDEVIIGHKDPKGRVHIDHRSFGYGVSFVAEHSSPGATKVGSYIQRMGRPNSSSLH